MWWPWKRFVMVCDRPKEIHIEQRQGAHRMHNEAGLAISWRDGWGLYFVHGVRVPAVVVEHPETITVQQILAEPNAEVRRIMCEQMGWERFVADAGMRLVDECPDPANAPHTLALYDIPVQVFEAPVRVLLCTNASPERDGTRRRFGLTCPAEVSTALDAAGWTFGLSGSEYRELVRAT